MNASFRFPIDLTLRRFLSDAVPGIFFSYLFLDFFLRLCNSNGLWEALFFSNSFAFPSLLEKNLLFISIAIFILSPAIGTLFHAVVHLLWMYYQRDGFFAKLITKIYWRPLEINHDILSKHRKKITEFLGFFDEYLKATQGDFESLNKVSRRLPTIIRIYSPPIPLEEKSHLLFLGGVVNLIWNISFLLLIVIIDTLIDKYTFWAILSLGIIIASPLIFRIVESCIARKRMIGEKLRRLCIPILVTYIFLFILLAFLCGPFNWRHLILMFSFFLLFVGERVGLTERRYYIRNVYEYLKMRFVYPEQS